MSSIFDRIPPEVRKQSLLNRPGFGPYVPQRDVERYNKSLQSNTVSPAAALSAESLYVINNIGIGTSTQDEKLTVEGNIKSSGRLLPGSNYGFVPNLSADLQFTLAYGLSGKANKILLWPGYGPNNDDNYGFGIATGELSYVGQNHIFYTPADINSNSIMSITEDGFVGIGSNTFTRVNKPQFPLHVIGNGVTSTGTFDGYGVEGSAAAGIVCRRARGTFLSASAVLANDRFAYFVGGTYGSTGFGANPAAMNFFAVENHTDTTKGCCITFETTTIGQGSRSERVRITDAGRVGIGTTVPAADLHVRNDSGVRMFLEAAADVQIMYSTDRAGIIGWSFGQDGSDSNKFKIAKWFQSLQTNTYFTINTNGQVGIGTTTPGYQLELSTDSAAKPSTNTWTVASDQRLKDDITLADTDRCYDIVKELPLKRFTWKDEIYSQEQVPDRSKIGWIAQDVQLVFPKGVDVKTTTFAPSGSATEVVIEDCLSLNADQIYAAMYGALQKLITVVETQSATISALEQRIITLEAN